MTNNEIEIHFSVGSAASGTHISADLPLNDDAPETIQKIIDLWAQTTLYRKNNIDARMK